MREKNKILIIITIVLIVLLVAIGLVMSMSLEPETKNNDKKEKKDNRCAETVCLSKVSVEESNDSKLVTLVVKNEGKNTLGKSCVNIISGELSVKYCFDEFAPDGETTLILNAEDGFGDNIKDYKIEKDKTISEENQNQTVIE